jgi:hypothetical protein
MLSHQPLELGEHLGVAAKRQVGLDPVLHCSEPQLLQVGDGRLRERLVGELLERRSTPQPQRVPQQDGLNRRPGVGGVGHQMPEPMDIDPVPVDRKDVARGTRLEQGWDLAFASPIREAPAQR